MMDPQSEAIAVEPQYSSIQKVRWGARNHGRAAATALRGVVGLPQDQQVEQLKLAKVEYEAALKVLDEGLEVLDKRDPAEYQKGKHQGPEGWFHHLSVVHGVPVEAIESAAASVLSYAPDAKAEISYQIHQNPEVALAFGVAIEH